MNELLAEPRRHEEPGDALEPAGPIADLFLELTLGCYIGNLAVVDDARRNLEQRFVRGEPELPHQDHVAVAVQRHDRHHIRVLNDLALRGSPVC